MPTVKRDDCYRLHAGVAPPRNPSGINPFAQQKSAVGDAASVSSLNTVSCRSENAHGGVTASVLQFLLV